MSINTHGGGAQTNANGLKFEQDTSLNNALIMKGFKINKFAVLKNGKILGLSLPKHNLYKVFEHLMDDGYLNYVSKRLLPDEAFYNFSSNTIYIIEKKFQNSSGSVDEKLQTCDFKLWEYRKMFSPIDIDVRYIYVLNDWFKQKMYDDVKQYIRDHECDYYFNEIPLDVLGL